jgi:F-type H+-transporting ATPase subunit epsilon
MPSAFTLQIATPERVALEREVISLVAPAYDGYLGVMANHAPLVAELRVGALHLTDSEGDPEVVALSGGFLSVLDNVAIVLADAAEEAADIDVERARAAEQRARERLQRLHDQRDERPVDAERARYALIRATNRLSVARKRP